MSNVFVKYAVSDSIADVPVQVRMSELPEISVIVRGMVYFADKYGYMMIGDENAVKSGSSTFEATNVYWSDLLDFAGVIPDAWVRANKGIARALTDLHALDLDAAYDSYGS